MSSGKQSAESEYEIAYRSTIQPRTAVRTQSRQSGSYSSGTVVGGGGGKAVFFFLRILCKLLLSQNKG
ncbi:unnamed protein product [Cercopithifilaria johnstoni]|uniref:Uncharacterized protein n=1 Tax=Cercopithifilaria johnstoni TaxID=2874296 RepID=A0A8J2PPA8_9BILA|nr:unnamed protein product [Cercopithifilaria johnstoni]